jgi:hypothetical protein
MASKSDVIFALKLLQMRFETHDSLAKNPNESLSNRNNHECIATGILISQNIIAEEFDLNLATIIKEFHVQREQRQQENSLEKID